MTLKVVLFKYQMRKLQFIIKNPVSVCPGCGIVLDFSVNEEVRNRFNEAIAEMDKIKSRYKKIAKFG